MPANRKKKTMDDLMKQVESDPRLQKTIASMRESFPENPQTIRPSDRQTVRPPGDNIPDILPKQDGEPDILSDRQTVRPSDPPVIRASLTVIQSRVYAALLNGSGQTSYKNIADSAGVSVSIARDAVSRLVKKGIVRKTATIRNATFQGFSYLLLGRG